MNQKSQIVKVVYQPVSQPLQAISASSNSTIFNDNMLISRSEYEELSRKASFYCDLKGELIKLRQTFLNDLNTVVLDPERFQETCRNVGAENRFTTIYEVCV